MSLRVLLVFISRFIGSQWKKMNEMPRSQRNPVEAYPQDLLFFFRVIMFLRGLCSLLGVRVKYVDAFSPFARLAILNAVPLAKHAIKVVNADASTNM